jgi:short-subunit dehydrogenase
LFHETRGTNVGISVLCPGWVDTNIADSGRNRPDAPQHAITGSAEGAELVRQLISNGLAPDVVAGAVVDAMRTERFWVLTHPDMAAGARERLEGALTGRNPGELAG